jgi:hypothetical protein
MSTHGAEGASLRGAFAFDKPNRQGMVAAIAVESNMGSKLSLAVLIGWLLCIFGSVSEED